MSFLALRRSDHHCCWFYKVGSNLFRLLWLLSSCLQFINIWQGHGCPLRNQFPVTEGCSGWCNTVWQTVPTCKLWLPWSWVVLLTAPPCQLSVSLFYSGHLTDNSPSSVSGLPVGLPMFQPSWDQWDGTTALSLLIVNIDQTKQIETSSIM